MMSPRVSGFLFAACIAGVIGVLVIAPLADHFVVTISPLPAKVVNYVLLPAFFVGAILFGLRSHSGSNQDLLKNGVPTPGVVLYSGPIVPFGRARWRIDVALELRPSDAPSYRPPPMRVIVEGVDGNAAFPAGKAIIAYVSKVDPADYMLPGVRWCSRVPEKQ